MISYNLSLNLLSYLCGQCWYRSKLTVTARNDLQTEHCYIGKYWFEVTQRPMQIKALQLSNRFSYLYVLSRSLSLKVGEDFIIIRGFTGFYSLLKRQWWIQIYTGWINFLHWLYFELNILSFQPIHPWWLLQNETQCNKTSTDVFSLHYGHSWKPMLIFGSCNCYYFSNFLQPPGGARSDTLGSNYWLGG